MSHQAELENSSMEALLGNVADEFTDRMNRGERPDVEDYARQYPEMAAILRQVLPALMVMVPQSSLEEPSGPQVAREFLVSGSLGDFRLLRQIGRGGMGVVYEAEQISLGRKVALKVLPFAAMMDPRHLTRFQNEARAAAGLHHTNIVPVYFVGCERGVHYYAMQLIEGQDLASAVNQLRLQHGSKKNKSRFAETVDVSPGEPAASGAADTQPRAALTTERSTTSKEYFRTVARLGIQAAEALDHAHQQGIVHRDIKPANLMMDAAGRLWVTDFGLAMMQSDTQLTMTGDLVGTLRYMSPEQALAKRVIVDHRTDIYSLGATLYELLTLEPAFNGNDRQELLRQIAFEEPRRPRHWNRAIPQEMEIIVLKTMERNPLDRYATAQDLADDLRNFLEDRPIRARRPSLRNRSIKWCRRHKPLALGSVAVALTVLVLGGAALWREQQEQHRQQAVLERGIAEDLRVAESFQKQEHWPEALEVLERAMGRLGGGEQADLRERVETQRKNVTMIARLEEARLLAATWREGGIDYGNAAQAYASAFMSHGLVLDKLTPEEAAERIRTSPISTYLVAALDNWAIYAEEANPGSGKAIYAVARLADDDPWRKRLFDPKVNRDVAALERLVGEAGVLDQPPGYLVAVSMTLHSLKGRGAAIRLLCDVQQRYPLDFWANFELAYLMSLESKTNPEGVKSYEAIGFYRVALSLRPRCPAVYIRAIASLWGKNRDQATARPAMVSR